MLLLGAAVGLAVFGGWRRYRGVPVLPLVAEAAAPTARPGNQPLDSMFRVVEGVIGAGGTEPLRARTHGHVWRLFFTGGDYARRGQVLVKMDNHTFVTAPRAGFLGPVQVTMGQRLSDTTTVTTLSRRSYLEVQVPVPNAWRQRLCVGDSARVWAGAGAIRVADGVVSAVNSSGPSSGPIVIKLTSRAPFRIGEQAFVRLHLQAPVLAESPRPADVPAPSKSEASGTVLSRR
jgi:hypothetical protein